MGNKSIPPEILEVTRACEQFLAELTGDEYTGHIVLSQNDFAKFEETVQNPPEPNKALKDAIRQYRK